jgi:hypothetical protein
VGAFGADVKSAICVGVGGAAFRAVGNGVHGLVC